MSLKFGAPDPNILRSTDKTDFSMFTFKSIGKEPELLKRISNREEGVHYRYSPSPEPESYPARYAAEARTRPSLLQALTDNGPASSSQGGNGFSIASNSLNRSQQLPPTSETPSVESPGMLEYDSMQLQYPEKPVADVVPHKSPSPPPPPLFIPDYPALKALHARLETSHKVLAVPPPPRKALTPPPDFPRPSLIAANNAVHHTEKTHTSAKEALQASHARVAISEQSVAAAQTIVDTLSQALLASRTALEVAKKSLAEARQDAEEAQAALTESRAAADAAEETKRLLEEPPPPRVPTPEPVNGNAEVIDEMKKDLDTLKLWVEEQEAGHLPAPAAWRDTSRDREEEEEREASNMMIVPDDIDTDVEVRDINDSINDPTSLQTTDVRRPSTSPFLLTATPLHPKISESPGENGERGGEPRREEDAAEALMALADQKTMAQSSEEQQRRGASPAKGLGGKGKAEPLTAYAPAERPRDEEVHEDSLAREATLRKLQEVQREKVRIQKEQAQAAAAMSILKERQDAAAKSSISAEQFSASLSDADPHQGGNVVARAVVLPPSTAAEVKAKTKKTKPVSGGVKLGPDIIPKADPSPPNDPSPALERAAALGLRVRPPPAKPAGSQSVPNSKAGPSKNMRNYSLPPLERELSPPDEISAYRTGSDKGDIPIIQPTKAPKLPADLSADIQLINLRFALQDEGITWEAICRSRPKLSAVKTESPEDALRPAKFPLSASQPKKSESPQLPLLSNHQISTPSPSAPVIAPTMVLTGPLKPLPSRKKLPKINKVVPPTDPDNGPSVKPAAASAAQAPIMPRSTQDTTVRAGPSEAPPVSFPPKRSPPAVAVAVPSTQSNPSVSNQTPMQAQALPTTQTESSWSPVRGSGATTSIPDKNDSSNYRPLSERVSDVFRGRSPPRYDARSRSRTPERYGGNASKSYNEEPAYNGEPARYGRRSPDSYSRYTGPRWTPEPVRRPLTPPRAYTPPLRPVSPPPSRRYEGDFSAKRPFPGDHYSPAPAWSRHDSPPTGPRRGVPRAPSNSQKRPRDEFTPPVHPQKRFKDDGRDAIHPRAASPPRSWPVKEAENERPTLEHRLGAPDPSQHFIGRSESYRPAEFPHQDEERTGKPDGLLSRLSDPARGGARGRGGPRGRANNRGRGGRGRGGERSLADRMD